MIASQKSVRVARVNRLDLAGLARSGGCAVSSA